MGVQRSQRLKKRAEFEAVREGGERVSCGPFIFQARFENPEEGDGAAGQKYLGVIASRRVGGAVKRNFGKRRFREIFRRNLAAIPEGCRIVIVLRNRFDCYSFGELERRFLKACRRIARGNDPASGAAGETGMKK